jgi:hypothetical protein
MDFEYSARTKELQKKLLAFMAEHIYPNEGRYYEHVRSDKRWQPVPVIEELKPCSCRARRGRPAAACPTSITRRCARSWGA